jgi:ATP-dependent Clp protease ATP-binding subunit ClpA
MFSLQLANYLNSELVGQAGPVQKLSRAVARALQAPPPSSGTLGVFFLLGPSGSGKTLLVQSLARAIIGDSRNIIPLNCSFYARVGQCMAYFASIARVFQSTPIQIIAVEGIEKASTSMIDLFSHLFSHGIMTLDVGKVIDFRRSFFILETAIGEKEIDKITRSRVGFQIATPGEMEEEDAKIKEVLLTKVQETFPLRFLSFIDETIILNRTRVEDLPEMLNRMIERIGTYLQSKGFYLNVDEGARSFLISMGEHELHFGAKGLRKAVRDFLEYPLMDIISMPGIPYGYTIYVKRGMDGLSFFTPQLSYNSWYPVPPTRLPSY